MEGGKRGLTVICKSVILGMLASGAGNFSTRLASTHPRRAGFLIQDPRKGREALSGAGSQPARSATCDAGSLATILAAAWKDTLKPNYIVDTTMSNGRMGR